MEYLKFRESVMNCPICRNFGYTREGYILKHYMKAFMPVTPDSSHENLIRKKNMLQKYSSHRDGYDQIYRKSLKTGVKEVKKSNGKVKTHHTNHSPYIYQVYTLTTENDQKPKKKPSRTFYSYPISSSSSLSSTSFIAAKERKKSITIHPSTKMGSDDEDSDSEFSTCNKFPITEKHYRHIVDGIECPAYQKKPSSSSRRKVHEDKVHEDKITKITKRADINFNQATSKPSNPNPSILKREDFNFNQTTSKPLNPISSILKRSDFNFNKTASKPSNPSPNISHTRACEAKAKKKCNCKTKCKHKLEKESSDSILSEKTFSKFINSLHSYVSKSKKFDHDKYGRKILDSDSSCSLCHLERKRTKRKKSSRENEHGSNNKQHHHHRSSRYRDSNKELFE